MPAPAPPWPTSPSAPATPVAETQAGKGALAFDHPVNLGAIGVTGTSRRQRGRGRGRPGDRRGHAAHRFHNRLARALRQPRLAACPDQRRGLRRRQAWSGERWSATPRAALEALDKAMGRMARPGAPGREASPVGAHWDDVWRARTAPRRRVGTPSDAQVIGAVWRAAPDDAIVVAASGGLPGELHRLWRVAQPRRLPRGIRLSRPWATRSPAAWASSWPSRRAKSSSWSATAPI